MEREKLHWPYSWLDDKREQRDYGHILTAERLWDQQLGLEPGQGLIDSCSQSRTGERMKNGSMLREDDRTLFQYYKTTKWR